MCMLLAILRYHINSFVYMRTSNFWAEAESLSKIVTEYWVYINLFSSIRTNEPELAATLAGKIAI